MRSLKTTVREFNDRILRKFGWCVVLESSTFQMQRAQIMRERNITLALDVGANVGQWATSVRRSGYVGKLVSFEPDPRAIKVLQARFASDPNWTFFETAVGDENGQKVLFQFPQMVEGMSSLKKPMDKTSLGQVITESSEQILESYVPIRRLDDLIPNLDNAVIHLKIDVQGFELEVLRGCPKVLEQCSVVEIEMPFVTAYESSSQFVEISSFLLDSGFIASSIQTERWSYPSALDCDALFIKA